MSEVPESTVPAPRVLIVEDDLQLGKAIRRRLAREGWEVECVTSGQSAVEAVDRQNYAAVVVDNGLPDMRGMDILLRVRDGASATVRILMTGDTNPVVFNEAVNQAQVSRFLVKPFKLDELVQAIKSGGVPDWGRLSIQSKTVLTATLDGNSAGETAVKVR